MESAQVLFPARADKLAIEMVNSPHFRGYNRVGWERTRGRPDWREQVDIGADARHSRGPEPPRGRGCRGRTNGRTRFPSCGPCLPLAGRSMKCSYACCAPSRWRSGNPWISSSPCMPMTPTT